MQSGCSMGCETATIVVGKRAGDDEKTGGERKVQERTKLVERRRG